VVNRENGHTHSHQRSASGDQTKGETLWQKKT